MPDGETTVQNQQAASTEQASTTGQESQAAQTAQALTEDKVRQMIADATAKAVQEAKDLGRRELQSQQDKNRAEVSRAERRAKLAESTLKATQDSLTQLDPDAAKDVELARLRAREQGLSGLEQEEAEAKAQQEFHQQFVEGLNQFITGLGVDPKDPRIDWAADAQNYLEAQRRVLTSVSTVQKEKVQTIQSGLEKRLADLEKKTKVETNVEANSVSTTTSGGVVSIADKDFLAKFGNGDLPMSKENVDRYNKIKNTY